MIQIKKLAIAGAVSAAIFGAASAEAHVMYNTAIANDQVGGTDGWVWGGQGVQNGTLTSAQANPGFLGTADTNNDGKGDTPFGYVGSAHLNWAAAIHDYDVLTVSAADAAAHYNGAVVEIDTGAGAWQDNTGTGWRHQTDLGLIKSDFSTLVRINVSTLGNVNDNFGVTVFKGMNQADSGYSHHGGWNNASNPFTKSTIFGANLEYVTHDATVNGTNNYIEFFANAGQVYTIALGGAGVGSWGANVSGYSMSVRSVPVPGAVWLFGSALVGMVGFGRRKAAA